jgi:hypothetical protein
MLAGCSAKGETDSADACHRRQQRWTANNGRGCQRKEVIATKESSEAAAPVIPTDPSPVASPFEDLDAAECARHKSSGITPSQLVDLAPRLRQYISPEAGLTWTVVIMAAGWLSGKLPVSRSLWAEACRVLGRERAAIAIALVSAKSESDFTKSAAAYFGGISRRRNATGTSISPAACGPCAIAYGEPPKPFIDGPPLPFSRACHGSRLPPAAVGLTAPRLRVTIAHALMPSPSL